MKDGNLNENVLTLEYKEIYTFLIVKLNENLNESGN